MNTLSSTYIPLQWDEFETCGMGTIYTGMSTFEMHIGARNGDTFRWICSLTQSQLETRCRDADLTFEYSKKYSQSAPIDLIMTISFANMDSNHPYYQQLRKSLERYPTKEVVIKKQISCIKQDKFVTFEGEIDEKLKSLILSYPATEIVEVVEMHPEDNHTLQRDIDNANFHIQCGVNNHQTKIPILISTWSPKVRRLLPYLDERGLKYEILQNDFPLTCDLFVLMEY